MKRLILLFQLLSPLCCQVLYSQTAPDFSGKMLANPKISSDRPGAGSDAASVMEVGAWQIESGTQYSYDEEVKNTIKSFQLMNSLIRVGILPNMELRFDYTYQHVQSSYDGEGLQVSGFTPLYMGTKIRVCEEKGLRPKISASMGVNLPSTGKKDFQVPYVIPNITFLTETTLTGYLSLTGNFGADWNVEKVQSIGTYALSVDAALSKRCGAFVEFYGAVPEKGKADHLFDAGLTYLVKDNIQVDVSSGIAFTQAAPDYFIGFGLSWMIVSNLENRNTL